MEYKIVIFDIGGTLIDKKISNVADKELLVDITKLKKSGIKVGVCSMRTLSQCKAMVPIELDFFSSYVLCDGRIIVDSACNCKLPECDSVSYGFEKAYFKNQKSFELAQNSGFVVDELGVADKTYNFVIFNIEEKDIENYNQFHWEYWPSTKTLVLQNKDDSKTKAIQIVLDYYNIKDKILYFADGPNDLEIFQNYKDCICMGSCYPELEKYALFRTETVDNMGVSKALRKLNLI